MILIPISRDLIALVDGEDAALRDFYWTAQKGKAGTWYAARLVYVGKRAKKIYMHRVIMNAARGERSQIQGHQSAHPLRRLRRRYDQSFKRQARALSLALGNYRA